jgi:3-deoxy-D-manno-octulosonate 8-phosphate phosphatase (KDO 8-P phosphatase)
MSDVDLAHIASPDVIARARKIKLFLMDVDGTLTDGGVCLISSTAADGSGNSAVSEMKVFNAHDGQGLSLAHTMGIQMGFKTVSTSSWRRCVLCGSERIVRLVPRLQVRAIRARLQPRS